MLPRFRVDLDEAISVSGDDLKTTVASIFEKVGVPPEDAELGADVLVLADLAAAWTATASPICSAATSAATSGAKSTPAPTSPSSAKPLPPPALTPTGAWGTIVTPKAMDIAIQKAAEVGVGMVTIGNSRHLGMASYHAMLALEHDMIGVCMTSAPPRMVPTFGAEPRLGTNPIAVAVPARNEPPFVFDAATSSVAQNKIEIARRLGADLEPGWLATEDGTPIMEEVPVPATYHLLPVGATRELGFPQGLWLGLRGGHSGRRADRVRLRRRPRPPQLRPLRRRLQRRRLRRPRPLQG